MIWTDHIKEVERQVSNNIDLLLNKKWRIQNLYPIIDKNGNMIPMKLNNAQHLTFDLYKKNQDLRPTIVLKSRQVGITTLVAISGLDDAIFYNGIKCAIQSHKRESMRDIFQVVRFAYDNMFPALKPRNKAKGDKDTEEILNFQDRSSFIEVKLEVRSKAINRIHFSEYAFIEEERLRATEGSLAPNCIKTYESTANGLNHFYSLYSNQKIEGNTIFFPWHWHDEYKQIVPKDFKRDLEEEKLCEIHNKGFDPKKQPWKVLTNEKLQYRRSRLKTMLPVQFYQEYPMNDLECFQFSGDILIERDILNKHKSRIKEPLKKFKDGNAWINIYDIPTKENLEKNPRAFFMGVDTAEGLKKDYSAGVLLSFDKFGKSKQAMVIHGFVPPAEMAIMVRKYILKYYTHIGNPQAFTKPYLPQIVAERNNHGHAFIAILQRDKSNLYDHLYVSRDDRRVGFFTTQRTRKNLLGIFLSCIRNDDIELYHEETNGELFTLTINDQGKIEAEEGYHDDLIFATALAYYGYYYSPLGFGYQETISELGIDY